MTEHEFERLLKRHLTNVTRVVINEQQWCYAGHIDGDDQYKTFVSSLNALGFSFYTKNSRRHRSGRAFSIHKHGDIQIPFIGAPFVIVKTSYLLCSKDGNYNPSKLRLTDQSSQNEKKTRFLFQPTKKVGCKAFMTVKCIKVFDEDCYKLDGPYKENCLQKNKVFRMLNKDLLSSSPPTGKLRFVIHLSPAQEHNHSFVSTNQNPKLHPRLKSEICHLVTERNICTVKPVKAHLRKVVTDMFEKSEGCQPGVRNRYFFPMNHVLRSHIRRVLFKIEETEVDRWKTEHPEDTFFFRPGKVPIGSGEKSDLQNKTFLFCHQTKWQRDVLMRHRNGISLLDATYKTCGYELPLFFIAVKTNGSYCVVGTFAIQSESSTLIEEALSQFKIWNPDWDPKYFLTDYSKAEISAVENIFPDSTVYLSAFHRDQSWNRWLGKTKNVPREVVVPLKELWQSIASSLTEEEYKKNLVTMFDSDVYQDNEVARTHFSKEWLPIRHRWVKAFLAKDFLSVVIELRNKSLERAYFKRAKNRTLSSVINVILKLFLPDVFQNYSSNDAYIDLYSEKSLPSLTCNDNIPEFFKNRSVSFIDKVMVRLERGKEIHASQISEMGSGVFLVRTNSNSEWHTVDFQNAACSCSDFSEYRVPCEHMCAVSMNTDWDFDKLPAWYRENPYSTAPHLVEAGGLSTSTATTFIADVDRQPNSIVTCNDEGTFEEECLTTEEIDVQELRDEFRDGIKTLIDLSYLEHSPEDVLRFTNAVRSLKDDMLSSAAAYCEGLSLTNANQINRTGKTHSNLPHGSKCGGLDCEWPLFVGEPMDVIVQNVHENVEMDIQ